MQHPELPSVSFVCFFVVLTLLPSQFRVGSVATIALITWLAVLTLIRGVNSLIWAGNVTITIPVWCDLTTKITIGFAFAIPAAVLCILTRLESIASTRTVYITVGDKRTRQIFDFVMCFAFPVLFMALLLSIYRSLRLRTEFTLHLRNNNSSLTPSRYFRLMAMAVIIHLWVTAINIYILVITNVLDGGLLPRTNAHSNLTFIAVYPAGLIPASLKAPVTLSWWTVPILCFIVFVFLGFSTDETWADYRSAALWVRSKLLVRKNEPILPFTNGLRGNPVLAHAHKPWHGYVSPMTQTQGLRPMSSINPASSTSESTSNSASEFHEISLEPLHPYTVLPERPSADSHTTTTTTDSDKTHSHRKRGVELSPEIIASSEYQRLRLFTFPSKKEREVEVGGGSIEI